MWSVENEEHPQRKTTISFTGKLLGLQLKSAFIKRHFYSCSTHRILLPPICNYVQYTFQSRLIWSWIDNEEQHPPMFHYFKVYYSICFAPQVCIWLAWMTDRQFPRTLYGIQFTFAVAPLLLNRSQDPTGNSHSPNETRLRGRESEFCGHGWLVNPHL